MVEHQISNNLQLVTFSRAEKFWYNWLKIAAIMVTFFGITLSLFTIISSDGIEILDKYIAKAFLLSPDFMVDMAILQAWMVGVIGATTAGWGISLLFLILVPLKRKEKWAWNAIILSLLLWFSLDTYISSYYGARFNIILNIAFLMQFVAPLLFIRSGMQNTYENVS